MASNRGCGRCEAVCECKDYCHCCPSICDCVRCYKLRKTRPLCEKCGHGESCHKTKMLSMYPGVRIDKLPDLDFLNPKHASCATGHSSERNNQPQIPIYNNSRCQDSENSSPEDDSLIFQMDDIDASLPPVLFSVEVAPESKFELPETSYAKATKYSPSKSSQRDDYLQSYSTSKSVSRNSISPKKYLNRPSKSEQPISENSGSLPQNSHSQLLTDKDSPETEAPGSESKEMQKVSDFDHSSEKIQPDGQESPKSDLPLE